MDNAPKDKLTLDLSDSPELKEYLTRKEPGDTCHARVTVSLDEIGEDLAILSVEDIVFTASKDKTKKDKTKTASVAEQVYDAKEETSPATDTETP